MPDTPSPNNPSVSEVQSRLHEVARMLRHSPDLGAESQRILAELVDELSTVLQAANVPPAEVAHLAESTAHLAESLSQPQDIGLVSKARGRLEEKLLEAESHAPTAVGLARRLLDALANIGI